MQHRYFDMSQSGPTRGDCCASYSVHLKGNVTVADFIQDVLTDEREWGYIGIYKRGSTFGDPHCEYSHGKLLYDLPEEILGRGIKSVCADGGWSRMDYLLTLKN